MRSGATLAQDGMGTRGPGSLPTEHGQTRRPRPAGATAMPARPAGTRSLCFVLLLPWTQRAPLHVPRRRHAF